MDSAFAVFFWHIFNAACLVIHIPTVRGEYCDLLPVALVKLKVFGHPIIPFTLHRTVV